MNTAPPEGREQQRVLNPSVPSNSIRGLADERIPRFELITHNSTLITLKKEGT